MMGVWADSASVERLRLGVQELSLAVDSLRTMVPDTIRDTVWVGLVDGSHGSQWSWHGLTPWMFIGWVITAGGIYVAARMAIRGWAESTKTARLGWEAAAATARGVQEDRRVFEENRSREQLILRARFALDEIHRVSEQFSKHNPDHFFGDAPLGVIFTAWSRYDRVSDNLRLLDDPGLEEQIDGVLSAAKTLADQAQYADERIRSQMAEHAIAPGHYPATVIEHAREHRKRLSGHFAHQGVVATDTLEKVNAKWPPPTGSGAGVSSAIAQ